MFAALRLLAVTGLVAAAAPSCEAPTREIVFPVADRVTFSDTFGAPRSGGRTHEGQDLMGKKGMVLVAAVDGVVTSVRHSSSGLSGNMLRITDAEGWEYVYIHLNNDSPGTDDGANTFERAFADGIRTGQRVRAGEPVGYLGDSGNAESTAPHLHFEIRDPSGASVNAFSSLSAARRTSMSPAEVAAAAPIGSLDSVTSPAPNSLRLVGWGLDRSGDATVSVSVLVDGNPVTTVSANASRPDVAAAYPPASSLHGFDISVAGVAAGPHRACVILHNAGTGGGSARPGCVDVTVG